LPQLFGCRATIHELLDCGLPMGRISRCSDSLTRLGHDGGIISCCEIRKGQSRREGRAENGGQRRGYLGLGAGIKAVPMRQRLDIDAAGGVLSGRDEMARSAQLSLHLPEHQPGSGRPSHLVRTLMLQQTQAHRSSGTESLDDISDHFPSFRRVENPSATCLD